MKKTVSLQLLIITLLFTFHFSLFTPSYGADVPSPYEDPRGRYSLVMPQGWDIPDDGRRDIFICKKEKIEASFTILVYPPLEKGETVDKTLKDIIEFIKPDKMLSQKDVEISGIKGKVIEFVKNETKPDKSKVIMRKEMNIFFRAGDALVITAEAPEEHFSLFENDFRAIIKSLKLNAMPFGGLLFVDPKGYYSIELPHNWMLGPDTGKEPYFGGVYDKGFAFCDVTHEAKPLETSDVAMILDYWKDEVAKNHKIKEVKTGFKIAGYDAGLLKHEYITEEGICHIVDDYIFVKGPYLFIVSFDTKEDYYNYFEEDFKFLLNSLKIEL